MYYYFFRKKLNCVLCIGFDHYIVTNFWRLRPDSGSSFRGTAVGMNMKLYQNFSNKILLEVRKYQDPTKKWG